MLRRKQWSKDIPENALTNRGIYNTQAEIARLQALPATPQRERQIKGLQRAIEVSIYRRKVEIAEAQAFTTAVRTAFSVLGIA